MNFLSTWQELEEIYDIVDYNETGKGVYGTAGSLLYHFYQDLSDLVNSLSTGTIYSTKNDKGENTAQYDFGIDDGMAYICMTNTIAGKDYMTKKFRRPFGISFNEDALAAICKDRNHVIKGFSAFGAKGDYASKTTTTKKGKTKTKLTHLASTVERGSNPFEVYSIGELTNGVYFICGGQGPNKLWPSQLFDNTALYHKLRSWFIDNYTTGEDYQKRMYYHFVNGKVGEATQVEVNPKTGKELPIAVSGNLNTNYKPNQYYNKKTDTVDHSPSMAFNFGGEYKDTFKEVIGYGPINVETEDGIKLLTMSAVNPTTKGIYRGPHIYGKDITNGDFSSETHYYQGQSKSNNIPGETSKTKSKQIHLVADERLFNELCEIFNEHEYRIYINNSKDFRFPATAVNTIVLPESFTLSAYNEVIDISMLVNSLQTKTPINYKEPLALVKAGILVKTSSKSTEAPFSTYSIELVNTLASLLSSAYDHVSVELLPGTSTAYKKVAPVSQAFLGSYLQTGDTTDDNTLKLNKDNQIVSSDKSRKLISGWPILDSPEAQEVPGQNNEMTAVAPIPIAAPAGHKAAGSWNLARLGSEVILTAKDTNNNKYVLFVYKSKSPTFMELPGGGFTKLPSLSNKENAFRDLLLDKLRFKCNIQADDITTPVDTGSALILNEKGVAKTNDVTWPWSYYRLYTAELKEPLSAQCLDDLGYTFDNNQLAKELSKPAEGIEVHGYRAHMRWVPVNTLNFNRAVTDRYSNIIHLIK